MGFTIILVFAIFLGLLTITSVFFLDPTTGLIFGLVGAFFIILLQYLIGPVIVRATSRLHYLSPGENRWLEAKVSQMASTSGIPMPRLAISPDPTPNAFVFGRTQKSATLAVHQGLLQRLNEDEIEGVIAHELGHVKHRDFIVVTMISAIPLVAYLIARSVLWGGYVSSGRGSNRSNSAGALVVIAVVAYVVYILTTLLALRLTRLRESYADAYSAYLTKQPRERELEMAMESEAKSNWRKAAQLFMTHPPTYKRILMLREIEQEMNTGTFQEANVYDHV